MIIDIDKLSESELIDLNNRIVERLRFLRHARAHATMLRFRIGERVYFEPDGHGQLSGVITRYNKKSVTVVTDAGERWNVSPGLLSAESSVVVHQGAGPSRSQDQRQASATAITGEYPSSTLPPRSRSLAGS